MIHWRPHPNLDFCHLIRLMLWASEVSGNLVVIGLHFLVSLFYLMLLAKWVECSPMVRETGVQSQVESYQRLKKKWYLMPPYLVLSTIRWGSRIKWSNPGNGVAPSFHHGVVAIEKEAFGSPSAKIANFTYLFCWLLFLVYEGCKGIYLERRLEKKIRG